MKTHLITIHVSIPLEPSRQQDIYGAQIGTRKFDSSYLGKALKVCCEAS